MFGTGGSFVSPVSETAMAWSRIRLFAMRNRSGRTHGEHAFHWYLLSDRSHRERRERCGAGRAAGAWRARV